MPLATLPTPVTAPYDLIRPACSTIRCSTTLAGNLARHVPAREVCRQSGHPAWFFVGPSTPAGSIANRRDQPWAAGSRGSHR